MLGDFAVVYLFLGGAGAGAIGVCSFVDLTWAKEAFGPMRCDLSTTRHFLPRALGFGFLLGVFALLAGVVCLTLDLGRVDRVLSLFLRPSASLMTIGSYALAALCIIGVVLTLVRLMYLPMVGRPLVAAVEACAVALSAAVMLYVGLLLQSVGGVALWRSPLLPALFLFSALSSGIALVLLAALFAESEECEDSAAFIRRLAVVDLITIVCEAICAVAFLVLLGAEANEGALKSLEVLTSGSLSWVWWLGFVLCGLTLPAVAEVIILVTRVESRWLLAVATLVLAGALCLRICVVDAGVHRELMLESASVGVEMMRE